jgi:type I restriction enzyme S subunit
MATISFSQLVVSRVLSIGDGYRAKNEELGGEGPIFLRSAYLQDSGWVLQEPDRFIEKETNRFGAKIAEIGDTVITTKGNSLGRLGYVNQPIAGAVYSPHLSYWRSLDRSSIQPRWLYYWAKSKACRDQIRSMSFSTDMAPYLSLTDQLRIQIALPPLPEQSGTSEVLGTLDDKIEANRRLNERLEGAARAIFKNWFVEFAPVRSKVEGGNSDLAPEIAALFPAAFVETHNGRIPEGWHLGLISELADLNSETWSQADYPTQVEYVDLANTKWGEINDVQVLDRANAPSRAQRVLRQGDTVIGTVRPGNGAYALIGREGLTGSTGFAVLRPKHHANREFVYLATTQRNIIGHLAHVADGAAYPAVRPQVIAGTEAVIPNADVLLAFSEITAPLLNRMELSRSESRIVAAIRDLLLPKLMSGEVRVKDAAQLINRSGA